ncbi:tetratricopeptide repeat protein [Streptomyces sp. NPDC006365]|uniref:tetratricopeptide repeat protein n=1 Tax=Streptomyces sp. NPDC006365 TaxID=3364744 RepID=UPI00369E5FEA
MNDVPRRAWITGTPERLHAARRWLDRAPADGPHSRVFPRAAQVIGDALARQRMLDAAEKWLRAAADHGDAVAMGDLGCALVDAGRPAEAESWLRRAADEEDADAVFHLGRLLLFSGRQDEARPWLERAIENAPEAAGRLVDELRLVGAQDEADRWERYAAEAGDIDASGALALAASARDDHQEAERWAEWAGLLGDPKNALLQARLAKERGDEATMVHWLEQVAAGGDLEAKAALGAHFVERGLLERAEELLEQAAEAGDTPSQLLLAALLSSHGHPDTAVRWLERAVAEGEIDQVYPYGEAYLAGSNTEAAEAVWRACAQQGHPASMRDLGQVLLMRNADEEAALWLRKAVTTEPGLQDAPLMLGITEARLGRTDAARRAYHQAAAQGDGRGAHNLGVLAGEAGDKGAELRWYHEGARLGAASSMYNLHHLTRSSDPETAFRWLVLAAAHGHARAASRVAEIEAMRGQPAEAERWSSLAKTLSTSPPGAVSVPRGVPGGSTGEPKRQDP